MLKRRGAVALPPLSPDIFLRSAALVRVVCAVRVVWPCFSVAARTFLSGPTLVF